MTNLLGVHALVWSGSWDEPAARHAMSSAAADFDLIEVPILDPYSIDIAMTRRLLDEYGMQGACSMGLPAHADVSSEDARSVVAAGKELLARAVEVTAEIGATYLCGVLYSQLTKYAGPISARSRANVVDAVCFLTDQARQASVEVSLEVVNRYETNVSNTAAQCSTCSTRPAPTSGCTSTPTT